MLLLEPCLMAKMDDGQLLAALDCESPLLRTTVEVELMLRLERMAQTLFDFQIKYERMSHEFERVEEQSDFRGELLAEIKRLCDTNVTKANLVKSIKNRFENSYVEL